jgi:hypothetical protein
MERTASLVFPAGFLELYLATEHLDDICPRNQIVDEMPWY